MVGSLTRPQSLLATLSVADHRHRFSWSKRLSSCSWFRMYSRITVSSRPTVSTKYPRAQKLCPTKLRFRSPYTRAKCVALFPFMYPTTLDTAYFGGIDSNHVHVIRHQMPFLDPTLLLLRQSTEHLPQDAAAVARTALGGDPSE